MYPRDRFRSRWSGTSERGPVAHRRSHPPSSRACRSANSRVASASSASPKHTLWKSTPVASNVSFDRIATPVAPVDSLTRSPGPGLTSISTGVGPPPESQASPTPSPSWSAWPGLGTAGQLSKALTTASPSKSKDSAMATTCSSVREGSGWASGWTPVEKTVGSPGSRRSGDPNPRPPRARHPPRRTSRRRDSHPKRRRRPWRRRCRSSRSDRRQGSSALTPATSVHGVASRRPADSDRLVQRALDQGRK